MKYILTQPATQFFGWQIDVFLYSCRSVGIPMEDIHVVCSIDVEISDYFDTLIKKYPGVVFTYYQDTREDKTYIPSVKQHLLAKHLRVFKELQSQPLLHVDSDIAFTRQLQIEHLLNDDVWYLSDTESYIGYSYVLSKGRDVLEAMLQAADINESVVASMQKASGGAQYLYKNLTPDYLEEVVDVSHKLYRVMVDISNKKVKEIEGYHPIQVWTAEMWAILWVAWKRGKITAIDKSLDFCWATDPISRWKECAIYKGAGVTNEDDNHLWK